MTGTKRVTCLHTKQLFVWPPTQDLQFSSNMAQIEFTLMTQIAIFVLESWEWGDQSERAWAEQVNCTAVVPASPAQVLQARFRGIPPDLPSSPPHSVKKLLEFWTQNLQLTDTHLTIKFCPARYGDLGFKSIVWLERLEGCWPRKSNARDGLEVSLQPIKLSPQKYAIHVIGHSWTI